MYLNCKGLNTGIFEIRLKYRRTGPSLVDHCMIVVADNEVEALRKFTESKVIMDNALFISMKYHPNTVVLVNPDRDDFHSTLVTATIDGFSDPDNGRPLTTILIPCDLCIKKSMSGMVELLSNIRESLTLNGEKSDYMVSKLEEESIVTSVEL